MHIAFCKPYFGYCFALPKGYLVTQTCPLPMQGAIFLQKFEEIATFEQKMACNLPKAWPSVWVVVHLWLSKNSFLQLFAENFVKNLDTHTRVI